MIEPRQAGTAADYEGDSAEQSPAARAQRDSELLQLIDSLRAQLAWLCAGRERDGH